MQSWIKDFVKFTAIALSATAFAKINVDVSPLRSEVGDPIELTIEVDGNVDHFTPPVLPGVHIQSQGQSTSVRIINGDYSKSITYSYQLLAEQPGTYTLPALTLNVGGKPETSDPVTFQVLAPGAVSPPPAASSPSANAPSPDGAEPNSQRAPVFITSEVSNTKPVVGEPVFLTYKIYHRIQLLKAKVASEPPAGVQLFELGETNRQEVVDGTPYNVIVLQKSIVPQMSGALDLPAFQLWAVVEASSKRSRRAPNSMDDVFTEFFQMGQQEERTYRGQPLHLEVQPIPATNQPQDFSGLVGEFDGQATLSTKELGVGETSTLTLTVSGAGLTAPLGELKLNLPDSIKVYADQPVSKEQPSAQQGVSSRRTFKFALVPKEPGSLDLGRWTLNYFSPRSQQFVRKTIELGSLTVTGTAPVAAATGAGVTTDANVTPSSTQETQAVREDLIDIHRITELSQHKWSSVDVRFWAWFIFGVPLLVLGLALYRRRAVGGRRRAGALRRFRQSVRVNHELVAAYDAYRTYLGEVFDCQGLALTGKDIIELMQQSGVRSELCERAENVHRQMEMAQYGAAKSELQTESLLSELNALVEEIESSSVRGMV